MLSRERFGEFFAATNGGQTPFAWQVRLLDHLLDHGEWPAAITAPTGAGKTSVIHVHVFAQALQRIGQAPRLPHRLVVTVNRRSIVDSHLLRAEGLLDALNAAEVTSIVGEVAAALRGSAKEPPFRVVGMRGGLASDRAWVDDPVSCMVLVATPDMWGSRLLFRGYGTSRLARPREAGLLAVDSVVVLDEAHLNRQLAHTARRVSAMAQRSLPDGVPGLQVVRTTATPTGEIATGVGVEDRDVIDPSGVLTRRLTAPKLVDYVSVRGGKPGSADSVKALVTHSIGLIPEEPRPGNPSTVLCVVNTIATAIKVHQRLVESRGEDRVALWVGRMRPYDLEAMRAQRPGLFSVDGDPDIDVLVTTQTVEVGVDIDCAALVTELAPGTSIAQRAGRVNRLGKLPESRVVVVGPENAPQTDALPYKAADLAQSFAWLEGLGDGGDISPWSLRLEPPPSEALSRLALSTLTTARAEILAETTLDHACEDDLTFWLRDDLETETEPVGFVVRGPLPADDADAMALLSVVPVDEVEVFPATMRTARQLLPELLRDAERGRAFLVREGGVIGVLREEDGAERLIPQASTAPAPDERSARLRPGDTIILDEGHAFTRAGVVTADPLPQHEAVQPLWGTSPDAALVEVRAPLFGHENTLLLDVVDNLREGDDLTLDALQAGVAADLPGPNWRVLLPSLVTGVPAAWVAAVPSSEINEDPVVRESWTVARDEVPLSQHQSAVADRARRIGLACGLGDGLATALEMAGAHHDDGKADQRFQRGALGATNGVLLAKGRSRSPQESMRAAARHGLPPRWRHEQASVVLTADSVGDHPQRDLVLRLVGTSHGHGRPFFPHGAQTLMGEERGPALRAAAEQLFSTGAQWADVLERTHEEHGLWGAAYLEALLRAADCQVSKEGS